ncbi:helix-turn-helix domain-containing protein [Alkalihalobacterium elongatum]|uniref:Lrp/AsnC family transcriptional regulator n=1 Tax=Alkalihalobacterium elongatum TaxID=2675466 RepID=UPI001C1F3A07|nr:Lrp/AsnC family transcriptional regulator [Alkalihalobacterium elongatum]
MNLTNRRKQFLEQIVQMYSQTNEPIHYSDIAKVIGVSKWTAYDVLKELEKHEFLERKYTVNQNETGRSLVVFVPTEKSQNLFKQVRHNITSEAEWQQLQEDVLHFITDLRENHNPIDRLLQMLSKVDRKVEFCAYFIGVLLVYLHRQGETVKNLTINMLHVSKTPVIQLATFVGAVTGMIIESASDGISPEMVKFIQQFMNTLEKLNDDELQFLVLFLSGMMEQ